jgi:glutamyl-tRNA reductase
MCAATPDAEVARRALDRTAMRSGVGRSSGARGQSRCFGLELVAVGLDHTSAGIELRERLAFSDVEIPPALMRLTDPAEEALEQAAILSTCNRVELYGVSRLRPSAEELTELLAGSRGVEPYELRGALYVHRGEEVARHLMATAAGLFSPVVGEAQIQGQVRFALANALWAGASGPELRRLFESAIAAGRRVRSETAIGRGMASVPQASVEFARQRLGTLSGSAALLIGAGTTSELAAKQLVKRGVGELLVLGRDAARATRLAQRHGGRVIAAERLRHALTKADVVISSTGAPHHILRRGRLEEAVADRRPGPTPLLLIDLAVPRDVDPAVAGLAGVEVHTLDDLNRVVERALVHRRGELPAAQAVVRVEVERFTEWLRRRGDLHDRYKARRLGMSQHSSTFPQPEGGGVARDHGH